MKNWTDTLTLTAVAAAVILAGCAEDGPADMIETDAPVPGDPAVYAPDGWPLKIGDRPSREEKRQLRREFKTPGFNVAPAFVFPSLNLVGDRVYSPLFEYDPTKVGDHPDVYRGHFAIRFPERYREYEADLPPEFHGKIEYFVPPPSQGRSLRTSIIPGRSSDRDFSEGRMFDADGRLLRVDPHRAVPRPPNPRIWPDYDPERQR